MARQSSIGSLLSDLVDLFELQVELFRVDSQAAKESFGKSVVLGAAAVMLSGSAMTVLLLGLGFLLRDYTSIPTGIAVTVTGAIALAFVGILAWAAVRSVQQAAACMTQATSELSENLKWIKATLISPNTSARNQIRRESFPEHAFSESNHHDGRAATSEAGPSNHFHRR